MSLVLSSDEVTVAAGLMGGHGFVGVDGTPFASLEPPVLAAVMNAVVRGLLARGVVHASPVGVALEPSVRQLLEPGVFADLLVFVSRETLVEATTIAFAIRSSGGVRIAGGGPGVVHIESIHPTDLARHVVAVADLADAKAAATPPRRVGAADVHDAWMSRRADGGSASEVPELAALVSATRVRLVRHGPGRVTGGEVTWLTGQDDLAWAIDPAVDDPGQRVLTPVAAPDLHERIRQLMGEERS